MTSQSLAANAVCAKAKEAPINTRANQRFTRRSMLALLYRKSNRSQCAAPRAEATHPHAGPFPSRQRLECNELTCAFKVRLTRLVFLLETGNVFACSTCSRCLEDRKSVV